MHDVQDNILLDQHFHAKVADFGLSRLRDTPTLATSRGAGNVRWMAPELLMGRAYDEKVDVFSFGTILYQLATGKMPYGGSDRPERVSQTTYIAHSNKLCILHGAFAQAACIVTLCACHAFVLLSCADDAISPCACCTADPIPAHDAACAAPGPAAALPGPPAGRRHMRVPA